MRYVLRKQGLEPARDVTLIQTGDLFAAAAMLRTRAIVAAPFSSPANLRAEEAGARVLVNMGRAPALFQRYSFSLHAYVLMSNHFHILLEVQRFPTAPILLICRLKICSKRSSRLIPRIESGVR